MPKEEIVLEEDPGPVLLWREVAPGRIKITQNQGQITKRRSPKRKSATALQAPARPVHQTPQERMAN
jgi:hypothetical protein